MAKLMMAKLMMAKFMVMAKVLVMARIVSPGQTSMSPPGELGPLPPDSERSVRLEVFLPDLRSRSAILTCSLSETVPVLGSVFASVCISYLCREGSPCVGEVHSRL